MSKQSKAKFIELFHNILCIDPLFKTMGQTIEASCWHRELSVLTHTQMVVNHYISLTPSYTYNNEEYPWCINDVVGALVCAFHDVGKPAAEVQKYSEARGNYNSYPGHELISARMWVDWAVINFELLKSYFPEFTPYEIHVVAWMIEKHLPFELVNEIKYNALITSINKNSSDIFFRVLRADSGGRIADDSAEKRSRVEDWITAAQTAIDDLPLFRHVDTSLDCKKLYVLIGASGSGKTTYISNKVRKLTDSTKAAIFSYDAMRLDQYASDELQVWDSEIARYRYAYNEAQNDSTFYINANNEYIKLVANKNINTIFIDNINGSAKSRRFFIENARRYGYQIIAITFLTSLKTVQSRQKTRLDKYLSAPTVSQQYMNIQSPSFGEFDHIFEQI